MITRRDLLKGAAVVAATATLPTMPVLAEQKSATLMSDLDVEITQKAANLVWGAALEINNQLTRGNVSGAMGLYMRDTLQSRRIFDYRVICDDSNNPADVCASGKLYLEVLYTMPHGPMIKRVRARMIPGRGVIVHFMEQPIWA